MVKAVCPLVAGENVTERRMSIISARLSEIVRVKCRLPITREDIRTAAHSPKGNKAYPRQCVEDKRPSNAVRHIPIGWAG